MGPYASLPTGTENVRRVPVDGSFCRPFPQGTDSVRRVPCMLDGYLADRSSLDEAGAVDEADRSQAAFPQRPLMALQRPVVAAVEGLAPVVGGEDEHGVVPHTGFFQGFRHVANTYKNIDVIVVGIIVIIIVIFIFLFWFCLVLFAWA